jgi:peptide/nickel transport system permease protein
MTTTDTVSPGLPASTVIAAKPLTPGRMAWRRFRRHRMAMFGLVLLVSLALYVTVGSLVFSEEYANYTDVAIKLQPPSAVHPFGTDAVGRDVLARTIYGGQISLLIGLSAVAVALIVGVSFGALSGYYGRWVDGMLMRLTEAMLCIPQLFLLIVAAKFLSGKIPNFPLFGREMSGGVIIIIVIIGLDSWMYLARIVRSQFLSLKEQEFVTAARCTGTSNLAIIAYHILPNSIAPIIVNATLGVASAILTEAYISFLGLGVRQPTATWGNMLENAYNYIESAWWLWFFPGMLIALIVLSINFLGDGLRDALDPHSRAA